VSRPDALALVLLLVDDPRRFRRAALRWRGRYCAEVPDVGFDEAHAVLACLAALRVGVRSLLRLRWMRSSIGAASSGRAGAASVGSFRREWELAFD
jgi:hypothetical protein